jgi:hypothetical protein
MLRVSPRIYSSGSGSRKNERIIMGNLAVAEELLGSDELDELYELNASDTEPDDEDDEEGDDEDHEGLEPDVMPHE